MLKKIVKLFKANKSQEKETKFKVEGVCNVCGYSGPFSNKDEKALREGLLCENCKTTSRYRSIAEGILIYLRGRFNLKIDDLSQLNNLKLSSSIKIYVTQPPFYYLTSAYPIPDIVKKCSSIDVYISTFDPNCILGEPIGCNHTNQNLEDLKFPDNYFDIVITSDVLEHVRLDELAHKEIYRVLKPGGVHIFTVPHGRNINTITKVIIHKPEDPSLDEIVGEPEYHGDVNGDGSGVLAYRVYGADLDKMLESFGFKVSYFYEVNKKAAIMKTELFYCIK